MQLPLVVSFDWCRLELHRDSVSRTFYHSCTINFIYFAHYSQFMLLCKKSNFLTLPESASHTLLMSNTKSRLVAQRDLTDHCSRNTAGQAREAMLCCQHDLRASWSILAAFSPGYYSPPYLHNRKSIYAFRISRIS